jgi:ATP-dependent RNA helicase RhlE
MTFQDLNFIAPLQKAISDEGYINPTPIQKQSIPYLLEGKDMLGVAQTGTGKTAAFVLPILQRINENNKRLVPGTPRALVLAPTRELAAQISQSFATYGKFLRFRHTVVFGGVNQGPQVRALSRGVDVLVATPGRLLDLTNQGHIRLGSVEFFVLDEIDRMLDMGFINDVRKIISALPKKRQSLFFSATMSPETSELAGKLLTDPVYIEAAPQASTVDLTDQRVFFVDHNDKNQLLQGLLKQQDMKRVLIFARTKHRADKVAVMLNRSHIRADAIHGSKSQGQRTKAMHSFRSGNLQALVATDIAARGIDINNISHVINYDLPNEPENYVHRIGRTGRAGAHGTAYSFCAADERSFLRNIERLTRVKIEVMEHQYHSDQAENAVGMAAKMIPNRSRILQRSSGQESKQWSGPRKTYAVRGS